MRLLNPNTGPIIILELTLVKFTKHTRSQRWDSPFAKKNIYERSRPVGDQPWWGVGLAVSLVMLLPQVQIPPIPMAYFEL